MMTKEQRMQKFLLEHPKLNWCDGFVKKIERKTKITRRSLEENEKKINKRKQRDDLIIKMYNDKKTQVEIVKRLKVTYQRIQQIEKGLGLKRIIESKRVQVKCCACSKDIAVTRSVFKLRKTFTCSKKCREMFLFQRRTVKLENNKNFCYICKKRFNHDLIRLSPTNFICTNCNTEKLRKYRNTTKGRKSIYRAVKKYNHKNPKKQAAWSLLNYHLKMGHIKKPKICFKCKKNKKLDAHHSDYSKPLSVKWYCRVCHRITHKEEKKNG